jgi:hypothetical protein
MNVESPIMAEAAQGIENGATATSAVHAETRGQVMGKWWAGLAVVIVAGCGYVIAPGGSEEQKGGTDHPSIPGAAQVTFAQLATDTTYAKVILKSTHAVTTPVIVYDADTDTEAQVACTSEADCAAFAGAVCTGRVCMTSSIVSSVFYVKNVAVGAGVAFNVPCDGAEHLAEIIQAKSAPTATAPAVINAVDVSAPFTVSTDCVVTPLSWSTESAPTVVIPDIYVGLGAPYDKYTASVQGCAYPWSATNWSLDASGIAPISGKATFAAPTTNLDLAFHGFFHLDTSLLSPGESPTAWELRLVITKPVIPSAEVTFPPN